MKNSPTELSLAEYRDICEEIEEQPIWRAVADKEMDYADGNQLGSDLLRKQQELGIPPAIEDLIGQALLSVQGYEATIRTDWRVTPNGDVGGQDVADALNYKLNQAERASKADRACSDAFRPQIGCGIGWVEVARESDPFKFPYRCVAVHRNEIHWDMRAAEPDLSDARWLRRQRWLRPERIALVFPGHEEIILACGRNGGAWWADEALSVDGGMSSGLQNAWSEGRAWTTMEDRWYNTTSRELCLAELWYRRWERVTVIKAPDGRAVEFDEANPLHNAVVASGRARVEQATVARVRRAYWLGPHCLHDGPSPYAHRDFPYVPFFGFREDMTGVPYGYVRGMKYSQDSLNSGISKLRWGLSVVRVERIKGAVAMSDAQLRRQISRSDADIVLDPVAMNQPGARFEVIRDYKLTDQHYQMLAENRQAIERVSSITQGFMGQTGTARSGIQEQTQVEQSNQSLARIMDNFRAARTQIGELLLALIVEDMGNAPQTVIVEGDAVTADRTITINQPEVDARGFAYLSNDLQRTRLKVALEDVPSTNSYRGQQLNAMSEALKSMPPEYQAAVLPFLVSLMDVPFRRQVVEAIREVHAQNTPEAVEQRVRKEVENELKSQELAIKEMLAEAQIKQITAQSVQTGVNSTFAAMQSAEKIALNPAIAPVGDIVLKQSGWQHPVPEGSDPNIPVPAQALPVEDAGGLPGDTTPLTPNVPQKADLGANHGIETVRRD
jgi:hypothetical protein